MKSFLLAISFLLAPTAFAETTIDETFVATFSDYERFDNIVTCSPGFRGSYPTQDIISIKTHAIDTGLTMAEQFTAYSDIGINNDPIHAQPSTRPYDEGCRPALEQLKAAIAGKNVVEVNVRREVTVYPNTISRVRRNLSGDVLGVKYVTTELNYESVSFELGGFKFRSGQTMNGKTVQRQ